MSALPDKKIIELVEKKEIEISGFDKRRVTSNGYDMLLEDFEIAPGEFKLIDSVEKIKLPDNLIAVPFLRTTSAFKGLFLSPGIIDAGAEGMLQFALYNASKEKIKKSNTPIIHLLFIKTDGKADNPFGKIGGPAKTFN